MAFELEISFLPRDVLHKRGPMPSLCMSVCHARSCNESKRLNAAVVDGSRIGNRTWAFEWYNFQLLWTSPNPDFKVTPLLTLNIS